MKNLQSNLINVISEVFEQMFFMFPQIADIPLARPENCFGYGIDIKGILPVSLHFFFSHHLSVCMAENFLGLNKSEINQELIRETLKETVNIIGGNLLNKTAENINMGLPYPLFNSSELSKPLSSSTEKIILDVENHYLEALIIFTNAD
jgi:hypothetical protein